MQIPPHRQPDVSCWPKGKRLSAGGYTRECLALDVGGAIRSKDLVEVLLRLISVHGVPLLLRSYNGPGFVGLSILERIAGAGKSNRAQRARHALAEQCR